MSSDVLDSKSMVPDHGGVAADDNAFSFFWRFLNNPMKIGALRPSSQKLCRATLEAVDLKHRRNIVELGPGSGVITRHILSALKKEDRFFAVEIDGAFYRQLRARFPETAVFHDSAENIPFLLERQKMRKMDAVISGLPWTIFPDRLSRDILRKVSENMSEDGVFVTLCYWHAQYLPTGLRLKRLLQDYFGQVEMTPTVWSNVPPIFLFRCGKSTVR